MNIVQKALAYGTPGVAALAGGFIYVQHEIHYWLTPAHTAQVGLVAAAGGVALCSWLGPKAAKAIGRKGKQTEAVEQQAQQPQELPQSSQSSLDERLADMRRRARVVDYTAAGQEVTRVTRL